VRTCFPVLAGTAQCRRGTCLAGPTLLFSTGGGEEYLVKAVQVLAFEVFYYLVIKLSGFSEGGPGQGRLVATQGGTGLAQEESTSRNLFRDLQKP